MKKNDINTNPVFKTPAEYVKLQDAYVAEKGIRVGNWKEIGYLMQNSSNYWYCDASSACDDSKNAKGYGSTGTVAENNYVGYWTATNKATLNDCAAKKDWKLVTAQNGSAGGMVKYTATINSSTNETDDCAVLTPNFLKLTTN